MFYGQGAGGEPTASAVLGDLVAVARNRLAGASGQGPTGYANLTVRPIAETPTRYHVSLDVADKPGVLATVAQEFARHEVSIATVRQNGHGDAATLVIVTHSAPTRRCLPPSPRCGTCPPSGASPASCVWRGCHDISRPVSARAGRADRGLPVPACRSATARPV
jgi:hypothetical protein